MQTFLQDLRFAARTLGRAPVYTAQRVQTGVVSANYFDALGVRPMIGRAFRDGEDQPGATPVVVLSYRFWRERLGGDSTIIGKTVEMTDRLHTVIGVLPPLPAFPNENDVFMPVSRVRFGCRNSG